MEKYGKLTFIEALGTNHRQKRLWKMRCDCGSVKVIIATEARTGHVKSCGCSQYSGNNKKHGRKFTQLYRVWCNMKSRCDSPLNKAYHNYGARGIAYQPSWASFLPFAEDMGEPPTPAHTLDRIDNEKGYSKENCRWATRAVQARNTRQNVWVELGGVTKCLHDWCDVYGITAAAVYRRLGNGVDVRTAITKPKAKRFIKQQSTSRNVGA